MQGPPGTGKTYVTSLLAQIILAASSEQILFLCYTNHALDQIMEHLLDADITEIVRVGTT
jgi:superfamily II DNA or RNA helicase